MRLLEEGDVCWKSFASEKFEARLSAEADIARCVQPEARENQPFQPAVARYSQGTGKSIVFWKDDPVTTGCARKESRP